MLNFIQFCLPYRLLLLFATFYLELFINIIFSQSLKQITAMILISVFFLFPAQQLCGGTQMPGSIRL